MGVNSIVKKNKKSYSNMMIGSIVFIILSFFLISVLKDPEDSNKQMIIVIIALDFFAMILFFVSLFYLGAIKDPTKDPFLYWIYRNGDEFLVNKNEIFLSFPDAQTHKEYVWEIEKIVWEEEQVPEFIKDMLNGEIGVSSFLPKVHIITKMEIVPEYVLLNGNVCGKMIFIENETCSHILFSLVYQMTSSRQDYCFFILPVYENADFSSDKFNRLCDHFGEYSKIDRAEIKLKM